ncbi:Eco57I restriction-modification methylase domain-containing protein [Halovivax cerinus]|uniref:site-specific DNA-methyltransferase (adenine-specific) n=1 Tax=Halovivax cerinus TaxID=1487865 RepID=A0ABD5NPL5_9EURY|nr:N-6 DNA methylase [Halovivax cerinus]
MTDADGFGDILRGIGNRIAEDMSEKDVENAFLNEGFYAALGYQGAGHDLRSEWSLSDNRRPDYVTLDANESVTAVYEFKTSGRDLSPHTDQLFHYVEALKADYGVLTNGEELRLYRRESEDALLAVSLSEVDDAKARDLKGALSNPEWDITNPESVNDFLERLDPVPLDSELGQEHFFDTFRLEEGSPFADLVTAQMDLLHELRDEREAKFVKGAYDFWEASYASEPDEVPDSWEPFINDKQSLMDFMFCLESGHALLARLLLAKATDDHDFFPSDEGLRQYVTGLQGFSDEINLDAYPVAANGMMEVMQDQLVESLFEDDIFIWWRSGYEEQLSRIHDNPVNQFRDVAAGRDDTVDVTESVQELRATRERFSRAVAHTFFSVLKFDFSAVEGDPLGDLYQRYFDPETRKALGEFYTPQPVIEYIMDGVGYDTGVSNERLIDPSCGSGTFLVEAVRRYLEDVRRFDDDPDWEQHLKRLCSRPHIVGLDIHPFAVLMAQIRFMTEILPEYREAKRNNPEFTIRRLPIFRTDTLRNERESTGQDIGESGQRQMTFDSLTEDNQDVLIPVPLPVEAKEHEETEGNTDFLVRRVRMPLFDTIQLETGVSNFGEYFAALQGVLDVVKWHMSEGLWEYGGGLEQAIHRYTIREYEGVGEFFAPYVDDILETVRYLKEEHNDGRLFKMFEDSVLALVVKNYMDYEYVVGNPPYVNIKHIPDASQEYYRSLYDSAYGRFDLYVLFIERGLNLLAEDGVLGYITSNKFARSKYGQEIRRLITSEYSLAKYIDFGDTGVFDDAVNYPCIFFIDRNRSQSQVPYAKLHKQIENPLETVEDYFGQDVLTESLEVSDFPTEDLNEEIWAFTPKPARALVEKLDRIAETTVEEACLGIRSGVASNADDAFIVTPEYAEERDLEDDLLYPIIKGKYTRRWQVEWDGELAIYPYNDNEEYIGVSEYPNIKAHLERYKGQLKDRYCVETGGKDIYEYDGPRPKSVFEGDFKIAVPDMATENHFSHTNTYDCFKNTDYVLTFSIEQPYTENEILGLLNSSVAEFTIKQESPFLNDRYYRYKTQYIESVPLPEPSSEIDEVVEQILNLESLDRTVSNFPDSYIGSVPGEVEYITYEWQTQRRPVEATIQKRTDGLYAIKAGRTDAITAPQIDSEERAKYVYEAVNGLDVESGEEVSIPIPRRTEDVIALLAELEEDDETLQESNIDELEAEIDHLVYDLFDLSEDEREIIENYLQIF